MISRIDHVSLAVNDFDKAEEFFTDILGLVPGASGNDQGNKFFWQIYSAGDLSRFELISPTGEGGFLDNFLRGREGGIHHVTFQVQNISETAMRLNSMNIPF